MRDGIGRRMTKKQAADRKRVVHGRMRGDAGGLRPRCRKGGRKSGPVCDRHASRTHTECKLLHRIERLERQMARLKAKFAAVG